jgi:hypothetical protein
LGNAIEPDQPALNHPALCGASGGLQQKKETEMQPVLDSIHADLLAKINVAVKAANEAEATLTTAQADLVSRSKTVVET